MERSPLVLVGQSQFPLEFQMALESPFHPIKHTYTDSSHTHTHTQYTHRQYTHIHTHNMMSNDYILAKMQHINL